MLTQLQLRVSGFLTTLAGSFLVVGSIGWYELLLGGSSVIGTKQIAFLEAIAIINLLLVSLGLALTFLGLTNYLLRASSSREPQRRSAFSSRLSLIMSGKRSSSLFVVAGVIYGVFFALVSGTLVVQPGQVFSSTYGVNVPSAAIVLCCGGIGQMPQLVIYVTQQFAILIVPLNFILLMTISWLVGLNVAIASYAYENRGPTTRLGWVGGLGATIGLFTACPTCAGLFFLTAVGLAGAVTLAVSISFLQTALVAGGIPLLLLTPIIMSRRLPEVSACSVTQMS